MVACAVAAPANADTLAEAIAAAYRNNPSLEQQRALLRALDEDYAQAASGLRPTLQGQAVGSYAQTRLGKDAIAQAAQFSTSPKTTTDSNTLTTQIVLTQPLYTGGRVTAQIRSAENRIAAGRQGLRVAEGDLLLNVVDAYLSVRRDQAILGVRQASLEVLVRQLDEARARRTAGEATITDVAQAEAQLRDDQALFSTAQAQLQASRNLYAMLVGHPAGTLEPEPELPNVPATVDEAFNRAELQSPDLHQAQLTEVASRAALAAARSERRPTLSAQASYGYTGQAAPLHGENLSRDFSAEAVVSVPIYTGGVTSSDIRRAIEQNNADRLAVESERRTVVQNVSNAWNAMSAQTRNVSTGVYEVAAAKAAYEGMTVEYRAGQRSTFEVLFAEQTLRAAEVSLLAARHDAYFAVAALERATGSLEARTLIDGVPTYDPRPT